MAGNLIGVFVLRAGVAGVAYPSLIARVFSAVAITLLCFRAKRPVRYQRRWVLRWDRERMRRMLRIAIPNGVENGVFQLVKVALSSVVALFGTYQIAANGIAQSIWSLAALAGVTMGPVFITVIGQCMGAGDIDAAERAFKKLLRITLVFSLIWNALVFALTPLLMQAYALEAETKRLVVELVLIHNVFNAVAYPLSGPFSDGLRAAGDVRFTMAVCLASTLGARLVLSLLLGVALGLGVVGIAWPCAWTGDSRRGFPLAVQVPKMAALRGDLVPSIERRENQMQYTRLGRSDLRVSRVCMGCMGFGDPDSGQHRWTVGPEQTRTIVRQGAGAGHQLFRHGHRLPGRHQRAVSGGRPAGLRPAQRGGCGDQIYAPHP